MKEILVRIFFQFLFRLRARQIKKFIPEGSVVCDICCGKDGQLLFELKARIKEGVGYDKEAAYSNSAQITLKNKEVINEIGEQSGYFDCVTLLAALEHLSYPELILSECFRILKVGGRLLITTPSPKAAPVLEFLSFKIGLIPPKELDHKNYFDGKTLTSMLIEAGFKKENILIKKFEFGFNVFASAIK